MNGRADLSYLQSFDRQVYTAFIVDLYDLCRDVLTLFKNIFYLFT